MAGKVDFKDFTHPLRILIEDGIIICAVRISEVRDQRHIVAAKLVLVTQIAVDLGEIS